MKILRKFFKNCNKRCNVLVIGGNGMLGFDLVNLLKDESTSTNGVINIVDAPSSKKLDASYYCALNDYLMDCRGFDYIINCAGYTDTMGCEDERNRKCSYESNVSVAVNIAKACKKFGCKMIHISTNEVFPSSTFTHEIYDEPKPSYVYGMEKYIAELEISKILPEDRYSILRTSWIFGAHREKSFIHKCIDSFTRYSRCDSSPIYCVKDEISIPTSTWFLSNYILNIIRQNGHGIYHAVQGGKVVSRYDYMCRILKELHKIGEFPEISCEDDIRPVGYDEFKGVRTVGNVILSTAIEHGIMYIDNGRFWEEDLWKLIKEHGSEIVKNSFQRIGGRGDA